MNESTQLTAPTNIPAVAEIRERLAPLMDEVLREVEIATDFKVEDDEGATLAGEQVSAVAKLAKKLNDERLEKTRPIDELKAEIKALYDEPINKLEFAGQVLRRELAGFVQRREAERAEQRRIEQERIDRERREAEAELRREQERLSALKSTAAIERAQDRIEQASAKVEQAQITAPTVAAAAKIKGFGVRKTLVVDWDNFDKASFIKAAAANPKLQKYLLPDKAEINKVVRAMQSAATDVFPDLPMIEQAITTVR